MGHVYVAVQSPFKKSVTHHFLQSYADGLDAIMRAHVEADPAAKGTILPLQECMELQDQQRRAMQASQPTENDTAVDGSASAHGSSDSSPSGPATGLSRLMAEARARLLACLR